MPSNHTEAEDAYAYAWALEHAPFNSLNTIHHILFVPLMSALFAVARLLGCSCDAMRFMAIVNTFAGVLALVLFHRLLLRVVDVPIDQRKHDQSGPIAWIALAATLALASSFRFWRYAVEAETPVLAIAVALACLVTANTKTKRRPWLSGFIAGIAVLIHVMTAVPVLLGATFLYATKRHLGAATIHAGVAIVIVTTGYALLFAAADPNLTLQKVFPADENSSISFNAIRKTLISASIGLGNAVASGAPLFAIPAVADFAEQALPTILLVEEHFLAQHTATWLKTLGLITTCLTLLCGLALLPFLFMPSKDRKHQTARSRLRLVMVAWFVLHGLVVVRVAPASPEMWIMALPPLWLLVAERIHASRRPHQGTIALMTLSVVLLLHNLAAGMLPIRDHTGDYDFNRTRLVLEIATPSDTIVTGGGSGITRFLRYNHEGKVINLIAEADACVAQERSPTFLSDKIRHTNAKRILILDDVLAPFPAMANRFPRAMPLARNTIDILRPSMIETARNANSTVYTLSPILLQNPEPGSSASP